MTSLLASMSTALSGLQTTSGLIQLVSENIANAGSKGYTAKTAVLQSSVAGGATIVTVGAYQRATDDATMRALLGCSTEDGALGTLNDYLGQVESLLGSANSDTVDSIADHISSFAASWGDLQTSPESMTAQTAVITAGEKLAKAIQTASSEVEALYRRVKSDISTTVSTLNSDLAQIANYNKLIAAAKSANLSSGELEDSRDQLILEVASIAEVTVSPQGNGTVSVYTAGGYELVCGSTAKKFSYDGTDVVCVEAPSISLNTTLRGGALQAQLNFIDTSAAAASSSQNGVGTIQKLRDMLDTVVYAFTDVASSFATTYNAGASSLNFFYAGTQVIAGVTVDVPINRTNIVVNAGLLDGSLSLITSTAEAVADTFNVTSRTFTSASGHTFSNCSYETLATGVISYFQTMANDVGSLAKTASTQKTTLETTYANSTGVSTDTELVKLTTLENAYNASAKVISVIQQMMKTLENVV